MNTRKNGVLLPSVSRGGVRFKVMYGDFSAIGARRILDNSLQSVQALLKKKNLLLLLKVIYSGLLKITTLNTLLNNISISRIN